MVGGMETERPSIISPDEKATIIAFSNNDYTRVYSSKKIADIFGNYFTTAEAERASETVNTVKEASPGE